jgi:hypothetical protein
MVRRAAVVLAMLAALMSAAFVLVPVAGASGKHLKLAAVVVGQAKRYDPARLGLTTATLYSVRKGKKKVGTMAVFTHDVNCAGSTCLEDGITSLKVGKVTGKAKLRVTIRFTGCPPCVPPIPTRLKSVSGTIFNKHGSEKISVNGKFPDTKGSKVTFALS